ncbi:hypothetical protein HMPREF0239_01408, partial [Clostridium sp. ATCC BAA-442]
MRPSLSAAVRVRLRQSQFERTYYITEGEESQESTLSRSPRACRSTIHIGQ